MVVGPCDTSLDTPPPLFVWVGSVPVVEGARCLGRHDTAVVPDSWSRILFHSRFLRNGGVPDIGIEALLAAAGGADAALTGLSFAAPVTGFPPAPSFSFA